MKEKLNELHREIARSSCTMGEYASLTMKINDIIRELNTYWFEHPPVIARDFEISSCQSDNVKL